MICVCVINAGIITLKFLCPLSVEIVRKKGNIDSVMVVQLGNNVYLSVEMWRRVWDVSLPKSMLRDLIIRIFSIVSTDLNLDSVQSSPHVCTFDVIHTLTIHIRILMILWMSYRYTQYEKYEHKYELPSIDAMLLYKNIISNGNIIFLIILFYSLFIKIIFSFQQIYI